MLRGGFASIGIDGVGIPTNDDRCENYCTGGDVKNLKNCINHCSSSSSSGGTPSKTGKSCAPFGDFGLF